LDKTISQLVGKNAIGFGRSVGQPRELRGYAGLIASKRRKNNKPIGEDLFERSRRTCMKEQKSQVFTRYGKSQFSPIFLVL